jgi:hypothetical protein
MPYLYELVVLMLAAGQLPLGFPWCWILFVWVVGWWMGGGRGCSRVPQHLPLLQSGDQGFCRGCYMYRQQWQ